MPLARVLVVDDELDVLELLTDILTLAGYEVVAAAAAGDALLVHETAPDVILLDIAMPDMDGVAALVRLRELGPNVPVVMLTANTDAEVARATLRRGAFDYITKPFAAAHLEDVVAAAVGHRRGKDAGT